MKYDNKNLMSIFSVGKGIPSTGQIFEEYCRMIFEQLKSHIHTYNIIKCQNNMEANIKDLPVKVIKWLKPKGRQNVELK